MAVFTKPSFAPSTAVVYITVGALMDVWTAVYFFTFMRDGSPEQRQTAVFWLSGFFLTGLILMAIGFMLGRIGRSALQAEVPPTVLAPVVEQEPIVAKSEVAVPTPIPPTTQPGRLPIPAVPQAAPIRSRL